MPALFKFANPIRFHKKTKIGHIRGVDLYVHWSVFLVAAVILAGVLRRPGQSILGLAAYWSMLLIHETGHLIAAQRLGCPVFSIELYPIVGITRFGTPWSRLDHCKIAGAGGLAQTVVAAPLVAWVAVFGYTRFEAVNMLFVILGFFSMGIAILNLLPVPPSMEPRRGEYFRRCWRRGAAEEPPAWIPLSELKPALSGLEWDRASI